MAGAPAFQTEVLTIEVPTPFAVGTVNCFVLTGKPLTLIDPGPNSPESAYGLQAGLEAAGLRLEDVDLLLLTHQHVDHLGLARAVKDASGCIVATGSLLAEFIRDYEQSMDAEDTFQGGVMRLHGVSATMVARLAEISATYRFLGCSLDVDRLLSDGEIITAGGFDLTVCDRPGHSPTDMIFVDERRGMGFVGDHLLAEIASNPIVHRSSAAETDPRNASPPLGLYVDSLVRTAELDLAVLYAGHGRPVVQHTAVIGERVVRHRRRIERVLSELTHDSRTAYGIACSIWGEVAAHRPYLTLSHVLGALDVLVADGQATEIDRGDTVEYSAA
jgi:glyoxylase-like metal-dependent hydrolase (beta-lactamase superfamily II)